MLGFAATEYWGLRRLRFGVKGFGLVVVASRVWRNAGTIARLCGRILSGSPQGSTHYVYTPPN